MNVYVIAYAAACRIVKKNNNNNIAKEGELWCGQLSVVELDTAEYHIAQHNDTYNSEVHATHDNAGIVLKA